MSQKKNTQKVSRYLALKAQTLGSAPNFFTDQELLELLLRSIIDGRDVKIVAEKLLIKFENFNNLINNADTDFNLKSNIDNKVNTFLLAIKELIKRVLVSKIVKQDILSSFKKLVDYLKFSMMSLKVEHLRILYLNKRNILIADEILAKGTVDELPFFPRELIKRALFHEAISVIIVHNHPSGSSKPSQKDIQITSKIVNACNSVNIKVLDHIIISKGEYFSFKDSVLELELYLDK
jgi:DNA repair protein RadC